MHLQSVHHIGSVRSTRPTLCLPMHLMLLLANIIAHLSNANAEPQMCATKSVRLHIRPFDNAYFGATVDTSMLEIIDNRQLHSELLHAFNMYGLLHFPNQTLTPAEEVAFMKLLPWDKQAPPEKLYGPLGVPGVDGDFYRRWRLPEQLDILCQGEGLVQNHHGVPDGVLNSGKPVQEFHTDGVHELDTPPIATSM